MDDSTFDVLEQEFKDVLGQLDAEPSLALFKSEYEKLHTALGKSHDSEKRLMRKCRELQGEIIANSAKLESVMQDTDGGESTLANLKVELEGAWQLLDKSRTTEAKQQDEIEALKEEIDTINLAIKEKDNAPSAAEQEIAELSTAKKAVEREKAALMDEVLMMRNQVAEAQQAQARMDQERLNSEKELVALKETLNTKKGEIERDQRKKAALEKDLKGVKGELEEQQHDATLVQRKVHTLQEELASAHRVHLEKKDVITKLKHELDVLTAKNTKQSRDLETGQSQNKLAAELTNELQGELKTKNLELHDLKEQVVSINKFNAKLMKQVKQAEDAVVDLTNKRDGYKTDVNSLERELDALKKQIESDHRLQEENARVRDTLTKQMATVGHETEVQEQLIKMHEGSIKNLEQEISAYKAEASKQRKVIFSLEKERDRYINEAAKASQECIAATEESQLAESKVLDSKKKILESEAKCKQQQALYEAVRSDRNIYSKNLIEAQDEIVEMKRKLKIMHHQIEQLKEEVTGKEASLAKEQAAHEEVDQQKMKLKFEIDRFKIQNGKLTQTIQMQQGEEEKLRKIVAEAQIEHTKALKQLEVVLTERDVLGTQLIRRNEELALVYEKIRIQQSTLNKGELQYNERISDIRILKMEIKRLRREKTILSKTVSNVDQLRGEVVRNQRDLLHEKMRCRALEEELETPMNVHRWRKLKGSDPGTYEMIQKIQTLQKRLIEKTEEVVEKEMLIQEKEKAYLELKAILARQPGPEVQEQLLVYQQTLKEKQRQMKAMASELNMFQSQSNEYRYEIERLAREMQETKKKYFDSRRKEQAQIEKNRDHLRLHAVPGITLNNVVPHPSPGGFGSRSHGPQSPTRQSGGTIDLAASFNMLPA